MAILQSTSITGSLVVSGSTVQFTDNVGIGISSPSNPLDVEGKIGVQRVGVPGTIATRELTGTGHIFIAPNGYHPLIINEGSSEYLRVTNTGNVGIGTTSPGSKLHVEGTGKFTNSLSLYPNWNSGTLSSNSFYAQNATDGFGFGVGTGISSWWAWSNTAGLSRMIDVDNDGTYITLRTSNSDKLRITSSGDVGIGTTSPSSKLEVAGIIKTIGGSANGKYSQIYVNDSYAYYTTNASIIYMNTELQVNTGRIGSYDEDLSLETSGTTRITVNNSSGNVGIGTTSPGRTLHVDGGSSPAARFQTTSDSTIELLSTNSWTGIKFLDSGGVDDHLWFNGTYGTFALGGGGSVVSGKKLHIDGGVSIGSNSDALSVPTDGLYVEGDLTVGGIVTAQEFHTEFVSASIIYSSGSTKFGDTSDDVHEFSGSLRVSGSGDHYFSDGNVGIGTTSPGAQLHIVNSGNGATSTIKLEDNAREMFLGRDQIKVTDLDGTTSQNLYIQPSGNTAFATTSGNVGIGTTSPGTKLDVRGNIYAGAGTADNLVRAYHSDGAYTEMRGYGLQFNRDSSYIRPTADNTKAMYIGTSGLQWSLLQFDATAYQFNSNGVRRVTIDSAGEVGIGTTSPEYRLDVRDSSTATRVVVRNDNNAAAGAGIYLRTFNGGTQVSNATLRTDNAGNLSIFTGTSSEAERMRIDSSGNVGIGTTSPWTSLVFGSDPQSGTPNAGVALAFEGTNYAEYGYRFKANGANYYQVLYNGSAINWKNYSSFVYTTRMSLTNGGNLGIGTTSPSYKLHVEGNSYINATSNSANLTLGRYSGQPTIKAGSDDSGYLIMDSTGGRAALNWYTSDHVILANGGGNVGIGTTTPDSKLHLQSASATGAIINLETTHTSGIPIFNLKGAHSAQVRYQDENGNNQSRIDFTDSGSFNFIDATSGTSHMYISTAGNVGIGTVSPANHISGTETSLHIQNSNVASINLDATGGSGRTFVLASAAGGSFFIYDDDADSTRLILDSTGNVGIGNTDPNVALDVSGEVAIRGGEGADDARMYFRASDKSNRFTIETDLDGTTSNDLLGFRSTDADNILVLKGNGNIGLGTTSPRGKLDVLGGIYTYNGIVSHAGTYTDGGTYTNQWQKVLEHTFSAFSFANFKLTVMEGGDTSNGNVNADVYIHYKNQNGALRITATIVNYGNRPLVADNFQIYRNNSTNKLTIYHKIPNNYTTPTYTISAGQIGNITWYGTVVGASLSGETNDSFTNKTIINGITVDADNSGNVGIGTFSPAYQLHAEGDIGVGANNAVTARYTTSEAYKGTFRWAGLQLGNNGSNKIVAGRTGTGGVLDFYTNNTNDASDYTVTPDGTHVMRMATDGKVGIGTTSPTTRLTVYEPNGAGNGSAQEVARFANTASGATSGYLYLGASSGTDWLIGKNVLGTSGGADFQITTHTSSPALTINSSTLNVGIGTTSPSVKLDIKGTVGLQATNSTNKWLAYTYTDNTLRLNYNGAGNDEVVIDSSGNVGIGTTSPAHKLDVIGTVRAGNSYRASLDGNGSGATVYFGDASDIDALGTIGTYSSLFNIDSSNGPISFKLAGSEKMRIDSSGQVYFKSSSDYKIGLNDSAGVNQWWLKSYTNGDFAIHENGVGDKFTIQAGGNVGIGNASPSGKLQIDNASGDTLVLRKGTGTPAIAFGGTNANEAVGLLEGISGGGFKFYTATGTLASPTWSSRMVLDSSGNVGIGTDSPGAKLEVLQNGGAIIRLHDPGDNSWKLKGDANFHIYDDSNSDYLTILNNGNVGISTASPSVKFQVVGTGLQGVQGWFGNGFINSANYHYDFARVGFSVEATDGTDTGAGFHFNTRNSANSNWLHGYIYQPQNGGIAFGTGGAGTTQASERMRINSSGNVGIGTTSPTSKLHIEGAGKFYSTIGDADNVRTGLAHYDNSSMGSHVGGQIVLGYKYDTGGTYTEGAILKMYKENGTSGQYGSGLKFQVRNHGANLSTKMILDPSGNLGIGTTSPSSKLTIKSTGNTEEQITVEQSGNTNTIVAIGQSDNGNSCGAIQLNNINGAIGTNLVGHGASYFTGAVGIGTTSPQKKLEVVTSTSDFASVGVSQMGVGAWTGIHFGYKENNTNYRKSAIVFQRTDYLSNNAQGKIHILNGPLSGAGSATLADAHLTVGEEGNVGIGTTSPSSSLEVYGSGSTVFDVQGSQGQLFSVTDDLTGTLFSVNDISGIPILSVDSDDTVTMGTFGENTLVVTGSNVGIGTNSPDTTLHVEGGIQLNHPSFPTTYGFRTFQADSGNSGITTTFQSQRGTTWTSAVQIGNGINSVNPSLRVLNGNAIFDNNVGIGTTSPTRNLHVYQNSDVWHTAIGGASGELRIGGQTASGALIQALTPAGGVRDLYLQRDGGNVGIGTTSPDELLHVAKSSGDTIVAIEANAGNAALYLTSAGSGKDNRIVTGNGKDLKFETQVAGSGQGQGQDPISTGTTIMRLHSDGDLTLAGSIKFNGDTAAANALDDYEEGTWTPVYGGSVATVSTVTYDTDVRFGRYTKVGNMVTAWGRIRTDFIDWSSTSGAVYVGGFPYTPATILSVGTVTFSAAISRADSWAGDDPWFAGLVSGQDRMYLYYKTSFSGTTSNITPADMSDSANNNDLCFSISYRV